MLSWLERGGWDLLIAFPECTHLCSSGARHFAQKRLDGRQQAGIDFFMQFANTSIPKWCIENPIGIMSSVYRKPDQIIQPWQFGHGETKATCLWLNDLPKLVSTDVVSGREARVHRMAPSDTRSADRSRTYLGIAMGDGCAVGLGSHLREFHLVTRIPACLLGGRGYSDACWVLVATGQICVGEVKRLNSTLTPIAADPCQRFLLTAKAQ